MVRDDRLQHVVVVVAVVEVGYRVLEEEENVIENHNVEVEVVVIYEAKKSVHGEEDYVVNDCGFCHERIVDDEDLENDVQNAMIVWVHS